MISREGLQCLVPRDIRRTQRAENRVLWPVIFTILVFQVMLTLAETRIKSILCITVGESPYESCREIVGTWPIRVGPFRSESVSRATEIDRYSVGSCGPNIDFVSSYNLLQPRVNASVRDAVLVSLASRSSLGFVVAEIPYFRGSLLHLRTTEMDLPSIELLIPLRRGDERGVSRVRRCL